MNEEIPAQNLYPDIEGLPSVGDDEENPKKAVEPVAEAKRAASDSGSSGEEVAAGSARKLDEVAVEGIDV